MHRSLIVELTLAVLLATPAAAAAQLLETETARVPGNGVVVGGVGVEVQASSEGTETAVPTFVEAGLGDRLELVVEPVVFTAIRPASGTDATGVGDLEATLVGLVAHERPRLPAIALAGEVKLPTARDALIGTRQTDVTAYLILSKRLGAVDVHVNLSYAVLGDPPGIDASNVFGVALAARYRRGAVEAFGEVLAETAAVPEMAGEAEQGGELVGGETVGTVGAGYHVGSSVLLSLGLSLDNNAAINIHPGITVRGRAF